MKYFPLLIEVFACLFLAAGKNYSQSVAITKLDVKINTANEASLYYDIYFSDTLNSEKINNERKNYTVKLKSLQSGEPINNVKVTRAANKRLYRFVITFSGENKSDLLENIFSKDFPSYISASESFVIHTKDSLHSIVMTPEILEELTLSTKHLTNEQKKILIRNLNQNSPELRNKFHLSKEVNNQDSTQTEYLLDFDFQKPLVNDLVGAPLFYQVKGHLSSDAANPANYINLYLKYQVRNSVYAEAGRVGPQSFKENSLRFNLAIETLLPNLIDLTAGTPRLRLKPQIKAGVGYHKNFQSHNPFENKEGNPVAFISGFYHIPVLEKYSIIAEMNWIYSEKLKTKENLLFNYSLTLGYETPLKELNVLVKIVNGKNEINPGIATIYSVGLLLNFLPL